MTVQSATQTYFRRLGREQTRRILGLALREQAAVLLESNHDLLSGDHAGHILGADEESITIVLSRHSDLACDPRVLETPWSCRMFLGEETYHFTADIVEVDCRGPSAGVRITIPEALFVEARRQYQRARFSESSTVDLVNSDDPSTVVATGELCNVSAGGIAVLIREESAGRINGDDSMTVSFDLPGLARRFSLPAEVRGCSAGGTAKQVILRMEFIRGHSGEADQQLGILEAFLDDRFSRGKRGE